MVNPNRIVIRGETSIAGENQSFFLVEGTPVDNLQLNACSSRRNKNAITGLNLKDTKTFLY